MYKFTVVMALASTVGALAMYGATNLANREAPQITWYNRGVELYKQNDAEGASAAFDQSLAHYQKALRNTSWYARNFEPQASAEVAALAQAHKGICYLMMQKPEQAVMAWKESLKINDGSLRAGYSPADQTRLHEQAWVVRHNLELLYRKMPSLAAKEGKGRGRPGQGNKQAPGNDPGTQPGRGNKDDI